MEFGKNISKFERAVHDLLYWNGPDFDMYAKLREEFIGNAPTSRFNLSIGDEVECGDRIVYKGHLLKAKCDFVVSEESMKGLDKIC